MSFNDLGNDDEMEILLRQRRYLLASIIVSTRNAKAHRVLKSTQAIRQEQKRQLEHKYRAIHPYSMFRFVWDVLMVCVIYSSVILETLVLTFECDFSTVMVQAKRIVYTLNVIVVLDIAINFHTGYYDKETKTVVLDYGSIAKHYVKKRFWNHLLFSIPWLLIARIFKYVRHVTAYPRTFDLRDYLALACFTRVLRYTEIEEFLGTYESVSITKKTFWKLLNLLIHVTTLYHLAACLLINVLSITEKHPFDQIHHTKNTSWYTHKDIFQAEHHLVEQAYLRLLHRAISSVMLCGNGVEPIVSPADRNMTILLRIVGVVHMLYVVSNMTLIVHSMYPGIRKLETVKQYAYEMARYKRLPEETVKRMLEYFKFTCSDTFFSETKLMGLLSTALQKEIQRHCCLLLVDNVDMLKLLPNNVKDEIISKLRVDVFLPGDIILTPGLVGDAMYFLALGKVSLRKENSLAVTHLRDGRCFGEMVLLNRELIRDEEVIAVTPCEVQKLLAKDFFEVMKPYPELIKAMESLYKNDEDVNNDLSDDES